MAKRAKKQTAEERAEIDAQRIAAAEGTGEYTREVEFVPDPIMGMSHAQAVQGANLASGMTDEAVDRLSEEQAIELLVVIPGLEGGVILSEGNNDEEATDEAGDQGSEAGVEESAEGAVDEEPKEPVSIVKDKFKKKYIENAIANNTNHKAAKRSNWDWLSQQLAAFCLNDKGKIEIGAFKDVLEANDVDHSKWTNKNRGWEGRFRMTGRVALQKVVANNGELKWPNGEPTKAPAEFIEKYKTKVAA